MPSAHRRELVAAPLFPELHEDILRALQDAAHREPLSPEIVVTPTALLVPHLAQASAWSHPTPLHLRGLTWFELALSLTASERATAERSLLSPEAAAWLSRRFLEKHNRPPGYFDAVLDVRGFRTVLLRTFADLGDAGLASAQRVERFLVQHGHQMRSKVRHALELYLGYRRSFESTHDDIASTLARATQTPAGRFLECFGSVRLWVYGFDTLRTLERRLLEHLASDPQLEIIVHVPHPAAGDAGLVEHLQQLGFETRAPRAPARRDRVDLRALSAPSEESEAQELTRTILAAAEEGIPFQRMAVITRTAKQLDLVHEVLARTGVPCWHTAGRSLLTSRTGRALLLFLEVAEAGLEPRSVLAFLTTAPLRWNEWCGVPEDPTPSAWERVARDAYLGSGLTDWRAKLGRLRRELRQRIETSRGEDEPALRARASEVAAGELLEVAKALHSSLKRFPKRGTWRDFVDATRGFTESTFVAGAETDALHAALERLRALDAPHDTRATRGDFRDAVRSLLADVHLDHEPPHASGSVTLGTAASLYAMEFDLVCISGLREGDWPRAVSEDPVLLDRERLELGEALGDVRSLPPRAVALQRDRWLFRAAVQCARRRVVVSFSRLDPTTGATRLPSSLLLELAEEREQRGLDYATFEELPWLERVPLQRLEPPHHGPVLSLTEFDALAVASLGHSARRRYVRRLGRMPARGLMLDTLRNARARFTEFDGWIRSPEAREKLRHEFESRPSSASQLATYATCPFRFFMRQVLRVEPIERDERRELSALEVGRLVHDILEAFHRGLAGDPNLRLRGADFGGLRERLLQTAQEAFSKLEARGQTGAPLLWELRQQRLREDLLRFLRQEIERFDSSSEWVPRHFEYRFGPGKPLTLEVRAPGGRAIVFRGIIDRLDHHTRHDGVCVVDYKSGRKQKLTRDPRAVQLVVYLLAACGDNDERLARSEGRFVYVTRRGGFQLQRLSGAVVRSRRREFEELARAVAAGIEDGEFFPQPGPHAAHCNGCDYTLVCDTRIARQVTLKSRGQQDRRYHALPDFADAVEDVGSARGRAAGGGGAK